MAQDAGTYVMARGKQVIEDAHLALCGALSDMGCIYDISIDNRGGSRSRYIYVRKPIAAKLRVSDHGSDRMEKDARHSKMPLFDIRTDGRGQTVAQAIAVFGLTVAEYRKRQEKV